MKFIDDVLIKIDDFQRAHKPTAFMFAVVKKYSDDQAGYQSALVTYYGFLSLFPMLLVLTTVAGIFANRDPELGRRMIESVSSYFPPVAQSLESSINGKGKTGLALVFGLVFSLYGARGIADAFRNAVNHIWHIPIAKRSGFPRSLLRSVSLITGGGAGFIAASAVAGWTSAAGHGPVFRLLSVAVNILILYGVFTYILRVSLPLHIPIAKFRYGAAVSAVGMASLQQVGGYILLTQSNNLSNSYTALFATTLGLLAWIYLQSQIVMYAVVIDTVHNNKLWPRSLSGKKLTPADKTIKKKLLT